MREEAKVPFFSVVIPAYNAVGFIKDTLDSVRRQSFTDYEIILVNDGSCDSTLETAGKYFVDHADLRHRIISQGNKGIGAARNSGIKVSTGEFIAFLDADDRWREEKLSAVKGYLEKNPEVDLVCHDESLCENKEIGKKIAYGPFVGYEDLLFKGNCISTSATAVRRGKLFEAGLFSEDLSFNSVEDYELWLRLSKISVFAYLHETLGLYTISDGSITKKDPRKHLENSLNVLDHHFSLWENKSPYYRSLINKRKAEIMRATAHTFLKSHRFTPARPLINEALKLDRFSLKIWATKLISLSGLFINEN